MSTRLRISGDVPPPENEFLKQSDKIPYTIKKEPGFTGLLRKKTEPKLIVRPKTDYSA